MLQVHKTRYNHDYNQYYCTVTKEGLPNGGGFSIIRFTLNSLFEQHSKARNYWTKSNKNMPLFRYTGVQLKIYRALDIDLVIKFQTCYPMASTKLMFTGCQPSIMMMTSGSKKIRCKRNAPNAKPYKIFKLRPPAQMTNKWYFQHNECNTGLLLINVAAASFDNYYTSSEAESSTVTLYSLNLRIFKNLNFSKLPTYGYMPQHNLSLYSSNGSDELQDLTWLGNTKQYNKGYAIKDKYDNSKTWEENIKIYMEHPEWWGNPFHEYNLHKKHVIWRGNSNPLTQLLGKQLQRTTKITDSKTGLTKIESELYFTCRYNPFTDKGNTNTYIKSNFEDNYIAETWDLEPPTDPDLQNPGFPLWLSTFGFQDYLIKLNKKSKINTNYIILNKSDAISPREQYYLFLDYYFLEGDSEELIGRTDWDNQNWYPQIQHQQGALNTLALCGPGAPKLGKTVLAEAKMEYKFHFKVGGCAAPLEKITDPST